MFDYEKSKRRIFDILNSKTKIKSEDTVPFNDSEFTYENGMKSYVAAMFLDIRNSTNLFKNYDEEKLARILRSYFSEIVRILKENKNYREIGIRGDCIYAIYSVKSISELKSVIDDAIFVNTFNEMFQKILEKTDFATFQIGIGLGLSNTLIIKTGLKHSGVNDYIRIGDSVVNASKLSGQGNKDGFETIVMDEEFYNNIKDFKADGIHDYSHFSKKRFSNKINAYAYHCDLIEEEFYEWIKEEFK